jgi:hypothetical protein
VQYAIWASEGAVRKTSRKRIATLKTPNSGTIWPVAISGRIARAGAPLGADYVG